MSGEKERKEKKRMPAKKPGSFEVLLLYFQDVGRSLKPSSKKQTFS